MSLEPASARVPAPTPARTPAPVRLGYRPALDGLRGLSILGVLAVHSGIWNNRAAFIGVTLFFVLSGFLITCLLLEEAEQCGTVSLRKFYARRALRLLPALLTMLAVILAYQWSFRPAPLAWAATREAFWTLGYAANWALAFNLYPGALLDHAWSLSIEEQFYLLWPLLLLGLRHWTSSRRAWLGWLSLAIFLVAVHRTALALTGSSVERIYTGTDTRADALLLGCLLGVAFASGLLPQGPFARKAFPALAALSVLLLVGLTEYYSASLEVELAGSYLVIELLVAMVLLGVVQFPQGALPWLLSRPWLVYLGQLSYGIYLWHHPIFRLVQARHWSRATELSAEGALTIVAVLSSYYLIERPLLRWKRRLSRVESSAQNP